MTDDCIEDGSYLYYDTNAEVWIRAGMAANRKFSDCGKEHMDCAKNLSLSSKFYSSYPFREAKAVNHIGRKGFFENLEQ